MSLRWIGLVAATTATIAGPSLAAPPECKDADSVALPSAGISFGGKPFQFPNARGHEKFLVAHFDPPVLKYPFGGLDIYGFTLKFIVGTDGRVECATLVPPYRSASPALNDTRKALMDQVVVWRFDPYLIDGVPSRITDTLSIAEEELPKAHVPEPAGDVSEVTITQDARPWLASFGPYHVELHGDGTAIYESRRDDDPLGPQTYHVDTAAVQALVIKAVKADFWSLRDKYGPSINATDDGIHFERTNITLGGKTKSLTDVGGAQAGMPKDAQRLQTSIMEVANIAFWQTPTLATLEQLKTNGFDFTSKPAGRLLLQMMQNGSVKDAAVMAMIDLGTPLDAEGTSAFIDRYQSLLEAALSRGRTEVSARLIASGALLTDGVIDHDKVNWAFSEAVMSGNVASLDQILPFHPDMTYNYGDEDVAPISIIRKLGDVLFFDDDGVAMAERLLALGADVNTRDWDGTTLLHKCMGKPALVVFLLDHGADINAVADDGSTPLSETFDEDEALILLDRGADPRLGTTGRSLRFNIKNNHWVRVRAWLATHKYDDVLIDQPEDDAPRVTKDKIAQ